MSEIYSNLLDHLALDPYTMSDSPALVTAAEECMCDMCGLVF